MGTRNNTKSPREISLSELWKVHWERKAGGGLFLILFVVGIVGGLAKASWQPQTMGLRGLLKEVSPKSRVLIVQHPEAAPAFAPDLRVVRQMIDAGIQRWVRTNSLRGAWGRLIHSNDVVGIKVYTEPGPFAGTRPAVVEAVVQSLLTAGVSPKRIVIWDKYRRDLVRVGLDKLQSRYGVVVEGAVEAGFDPKHFYDNPVPGTLVWGDLEFRPGELIQGRHSYVTRLLTHRITRIINIAPLLNHNGIGVCGCLYSLALGSVDNVIRFTKDPERLAVAVPEIYARPEIHDKVALHIVDALIGQYYGEDTGLMHYAAVLNQLRFSTDPVALDLLSVQELEALRKKYGQAQLHPSLELYHNAAILELGEDDLRQAEIEWLNLPAKKKAHSSTQATSGQEGEPRL